MFISPFTMILSGSTGSGKTQWLLRFLKHHKELIWPVPRHILYCYGELNSSVLSLREQGIETFHGVPDEKMIREKPKNLLLILDDLLVDVQNQYLDLLFTRQSHNLDISVVFVTQSLYGKNIRVARTNSHYLILMKQRANQLQIRTLGTQLFPTKLQYFMESFENATEKNFSYLVVNMHPQTPENLRLSTNIFPNEKTVIFLPLLG